MAKKPKKAQHKLPKQVAHVVKVDEEEVIDGSREAADVGPELNTEPEIRTQPEAAESGLEDLNETHIESVQEKVETDERKDEKLVTNERKEEKLVAGVDDEDTSDKTILTQVEDLKLNGTENTQKETGQLVLPEKATEPQEVEKAEEDKPKSRKRLTLQERLALAAKGKKKTVSRSQSPAPEKEESVREDKSGEKLEEKPTGEAEKPNTELEIQRLTRLNAELQEELVAAKAQAGDKKQKELLAKLDAKEDTIKQLLKEGEALSIKELKLNDTIKSMKATTADLEQSLKELSEKHDNSLIQLNELEQFLTAHKFKSLEHALGDFSAQSAHLQQLQQELDKERAHNWERKYKEQQKMYESELDAKKSALKEVNEVKIQLEMAKSQAALDVGSKQLAIDNLKKQMASMKDEFSQESARLESKLEFYRVETESQLVDKDAIKGKVVEYDEFAKLSDAHHSLQQQYISSQENWKLIELNLLAKVDSLTSTIDNLKRIKLKLSNELKRTQAELSQEKADREQLQTTYDELVKAHSELEFDAKMKLQDLVEANEKFEKFKQIFNKDRQALEAKIKTLELRKPPPLERENGLTIEPPPRIQFRSTSLESTPHWGDIRLGELSTTPAISRDFLGVFANNLLSTLLHDADSYSGDDSFSLHSKSINHSILNVLPAAGGSNNIQLITKMSLSIRRLEIEINALKDENAALVADQESAQQEILAKIKETEELHALKDQLEQLQREVDAKAAHEQTLLEVIGEKSEQVEELRADVADLKDLCRQQVQQMIEMQEKA